MLFPPIPTSLAVHSQPHRTQTRHTAGRHQPRRQLPPRPSHAPSATRASAHPAATNRHAAPR
ncbi:unnamed protein product [Chondrus crispus]|uniref:Uncharacterized protein n=1 Tax=Chondrus crispus TaxID=2769 RepID=R7QHH7_CHOCR|nr:unnamed protein product [Chondrus crispus]CDF37499.1 unnamed protein product [Chondrus crispus]|eukprot:XP_005717370.1 unnamed protein product [Chondrus crispus]